MANLSTMTAAELKAHTMKVIARKDRAELDAIKAETLARCAQKLADGTATNELVRKTERLTEIVARKG